MNTVGEVIKVAESQVGYLEKRSNKDLDSKTANAGNQNYTKFGKWYGLNPDYWCAMFLCWCFNEAYGEREGKKLLCGGYSASCEVLRKQFFAKGQFHKSNPQKGDVIFFDGSRHAGANHIGLVYKVSNGTVYTIEGNTAGGSSVIDNGGGVAKKNYSVNYTRILGYGRPKYDTKKEEKPKASLYYPKYTGKSPKVDVVLKAVGVPEAYRGNWKKRRPLAIKNGIAPYTGTATQNKRLIDYAKRGLLVKM